MTSGDSSFINLFALLRTFDRWESELWLEVTSQKSIRHNKACRCEAERNCLDENKKLSGLDVFNFFNVQNRKEEVDTGIRCRNPSDDKRAVESKSRRDKENVSEVIKIRSK